MSTNDTLFLNTADVVLFSKLEFIPNTGSNRTFICNMYNAAGDQFSSVAYYSEPTDAYAAAYAKFTNSQPTTLVANLPTNTTTTQTAVTPQFASKLSEGKYRGRWYG